MKLAKTIRTISAIIMGFGVVYSIFLCDTIENKETLYIFFATLSLAFMILFSSIAYKFSDDWIYYEERRLKRKKQRKEELNIEID